VVSRTNLLSPATFLATAQQEWKVWSQSELIIPADRDALIQQIRQAERVSGCRYCAPVKSGSICP
jgi:hypothetical protein